MFTPAFSFPAPACCQVEQWRREAEKITVTVRGQQATLLCPGCGRASRRLPSHCGRQLADLPWCGVAGRVTLPVRRFYGNHPDRGVEQAVILVANSLTASIPRHIDDRRSVVQGRQAAPSKPS